MSRRNPPASQQRRLILFATVFLALFWVTVLSPVHSFGFQFARLSWFGMIAFSAWRYGGAISCVTCLVAAILVSARLLRLEQVTGLNVPGGLFLDPGFFAAALFLGGKASRPDRSVEYARRPVQPMVWEYKGVPVGRHIEVKESSEHYLETARAFLERLEDPLDAVKECLREQNAQGHNQDRTLALVESMDETMERFKDYAHPVKVTRIPLDLNTAVQPIVALVQQAVPAMRMECRLHEKPVLAAIAQESLERLCLPLLENAVAAAGPEGTVTISTFGNGERSCLEVTDTGPGVPEELMDRIFLPFTSTRQNAEGMGLAVVLRTVRSLGAHLTVMNLVGGGCSFKVVFEKPSQVRAGQQQVRV